MWQKVRRADGYHCAYCNQLVDKDASTCVGCGKELDQPSDAPLASELEQHLEVSATPRPSQTPWYLTWKGGCAGCLGAILLLSLLCAICPSTDTNPGTSTSKSKPTEEWTFILNESGIVEPASRRIHRVRLEAGHHMGELYGLSDILDMEVVDSNSGELPRDELRNSENLGRFHWYVPKTGDYKVVVSNLSLNTRTDYIVKFWKGNWSH